MQPRGIRNHNPGNIRRSADPWQGLADHQLDKAFFQFKEASYGIRALARVLITYQDKHNLRRIDDIIKRWAPPTENDTLAYVSAVASAVGVDRFAVIDLHDFETLKALVLAIIKHENGVQPYTDAQITKGLVLAGVEPQTRPLVQTRTAGGAVISSAGVGGGVVLDALTESANQIEPLLPYVDSLKWVFVALTLAGIVLTIYARLDDRRKGLR